MVSSESNPFGQCLAFVQQQPPEVVLAGSSSIILFLVALFKLAQQGNKKAAKKFLEVEEMHKKGADGRR